MFFSGAKTNNAAFITDPVFCPFFPHLGFTPCSLLHSQECHEQRRLIWVVSIITHSWIRRTCQTLLIHRRRLQCRLHRLTLCHSVHLPMPPTPLPRPKRDMFVAHVSVRSPQVDTWLDILEFTPGSAIISAPSLVVRRVVRGRTTCNNSKSKLSPTVARIVPANHNSDSYRIHLSPGSRRNSARSSGARKRFTTTTSSESVISPPPLTPPPLEQARVYAQNSPPPHSPPPLVQATLPAATTLPIPSSRFESASGRLSSSSPDSYLGSQGLTLSGSGHLNYNYRSGTTTYQEQSQTSGSGFTYVHTTPISGPSSSGSGNNSGSGNFVSYQNTPTNFNSQHPQQHSTHLRNVPAPISSRHSISHINNPHYPPSQHPNDNPPSPASHSVSSHHSAASGPPTPPYSLSYDDGHSYSHNSHEMLTVHSGIHNGHMGAQSHYLQNGYSSNAVGHVPRFASPPPTLAPIQDERYIRRQEPRHLQTHVSSPYIHQPQPLSTEYSYHHMSLGHGAWRGDVRKGIGATVVLNSWQCGFCLCYRLQQFWNYKSVLVLLHSLLILCITYIHGVFDNCIYRRITW